MQTQNIVARRSAIFQRRVCI